MKLKIYICSLVSMLLASSAIGQTSVNSPYTRYGFGQLRDQPMGQNIGMGGVTIGLRDRSYINPSNPASYTAIDSLTLLFDIGMSLQNANFTEGNAKTNARNGSFDFAVVHFRLKKFMGFTAGFMPYSSVGYNFSDYQMVTDDEHGKTYVTNSYVGEGGTQELFAGLGVKIWDNWSVGANVGYLFGDITHNTASVFSNSDAYSSLKGDKFDVSDLKFNLGTQYTYKFKSQKKQTITAGVTYAFAKDLHGNGQRFTQTYSGNTVMTQHIDTVRNAFSLPMSIGFGLAYTFDRRLTVAADYTMQKWGDAKYFGDDTYYNNRNKVCFGVEYIPDPISRHNVLKRIRYRAGVRYSNSYAKIGDMYNSDELSASIGLGIPLFRFNAFTYLNLAGEITKVKPKLNKYVEETRLRISASLTINERWFMKWKVE